MWERAVEISRGPAPDLPAVLLHSDFHPGNVLWRYGRVSGVVDWPGACSGPAAADVGHCRINLLTMGAEVASRLDVSGPADRSAGALVMSISSGAATTGTPLTISKRNLPSPIWVTSRGREHGPVPVGPGAG